jgi:hypothetical protein
MVEQFDGTFTKITTTNEAVALKRLQRGVRSINLALPKLSLLSNGAQLQALLDYTNCLIDKGKESKMVVIEMTQEQCERRSFRLPPNVLIS